MMTAEKALELLNDMEFSEKYQGIQEYAEMLLLCKEALVLVKQQQAEIERLKSMNQAKLDCIHDLQSENEILSRNADTAFQDGLNERRELFEPEIRAEVCKEVADKLIPLYETLCVNKSDWEYEINNLLKELVGEEKRPANTVKMNFVQTLTVLPLLIIVRVRITIMLNYVNLLKIGQKLSATFTITLNCWRCRQWLIIKVANIAKEERTLKSRLLLIIR